MGKSEGDNIYAVETFFTQKLNTAKTRLFDKHGFYYHFVTYKITKWIDRVNSDIINMHNIHGNYINVEILFKYIKKQHTCDLDTS